MTESDADILKIENQVFSPGDSGVAKISVSRLPSGTPISIRCHVYRSFNPGPTVLILAGVHGDEINGVEIARRCLATGVFDNLKRGNVIVVPLLNIYGFINFSREVPDGKDVNRSFPGTMAGSLASRVAATLTKKILPLADYAIDLHTGGASRYNYPQIRFSRKDKMAKELALVFGAPFIIQKGVISKSFRKTANEMNVTVLVYEAGESERLCGFSIEIGVEGIKRVLQLLNMIQKSNSDQRHVKMVTKTGWVRASDAGIFIWTQKSGKKIARGEILGSIYSPQGDRIKKVIAKKGGHIIGHNNASVVHIGDALFHIAYDAEELN